MHCATTISFDRFIDDAETRVVEVLVPIAGDVRVDDDGVYVVDVEEPPESWKHWPLEVDPTARAFSPGELERVEQALIAVYEAAPVPFARDAEAA